MSPAFRTFSIHFTLRAFSERRLTVRTSVSRFSFLSLPKQRALDVRLFSRPLSTPPTTPVSISTPQYHVQFRPLLLRSLRHHHPVRSSQDGVALVNRSEGSPSSQS